MYHPIKAPSHPWQQRDELAIPTPEHKKIK